MAFAPWAFLKSAGKPVIFAVQCRFLHPRSGENDRRILWRCFRVAVEGSMSRCIHTALLRLQEIWLAKFVVTGLLMPGAALLRNKLPSQLGSVLGNFAVYTAYAMVSSGHLPLMMPMLLLASLAEGHEQEEQSSRYHPKTITLQHLNFLNLFWVP